MAQRQVSPERKKVYYVGLVIQVVGFLSFGSVFVSAFLNFANFDNFVARSRSEMARAVIGMALIIAGGLLRRSGQMGLAGSGIKLDPEQARKDVEPWARMSGGVLKDALDEAGITPGRNTASSQTLAFDERLRRLQKLRQDGVLNEDEYMAVKKRILEEV